MCQKLVFIKKQPSFVYHRNMISQAAVAPIYPLDKAQLVHKTFYNLVSCYFIPVNSDSYNVFVMYCNVLLALTVPRSLILDHIFNSLLFAYSNMKEEAEGA